MASLVTAESLFGLRSLLKFRFRRRDGHLSSLGQAAGLAAALLVGLLAYLVASPEAHEYFHPDAGTTHHQCVVTEFASGEGYTLAAIIVVQPAVVTAEVVVVTAVRPATAARFLLRPICGPPSAA